MTVIWWIRRDLRLHDNQALSTALESGMPVQPLFIFDPNLLNSDYVGDKRLAFLFASLRALDNDLQAVGSYLLTRRGDPAEVLGELRAELEYQKVVAERDHSPYAQRRDHRVGTVVPLQRVGSSAIRLPGSVRKADDDPYVVFSPFRNRWMEGRLPSPQDVLPAPDSITSPAPLEGVGIPEDPDYQLNDEFPIGEENARQRLLEFTEPDGIIAGYANQRNRMAAHGTSRLSPYLRFGIISPREAFVAAREAQARQDSHDARQGSSTWIEELIWRDFYLHILNFFPRARTENFRQKYDALNWRNDQAEFEAWTEGKTGYPVVDAAMRQLKSIGWMHNRARMIVASFLVKDLLVDWRWGERHFMQHLIDGDPASNNGGWQWAAGTGTDAAPYFRIFNPVSQSEKHDPEGTYIRRWVPELELIPNKRVHEPWTLSQDEQAEYECVIGQDYPAPIVDHSRARERALNAYRSID
jgi:deoxyribodipyrimidine photo-lyase